MADSEITTYLDLRRKAIRKAYGHLNDRQFEAVTTVNGPVLVLAGAGSGKTTVLVNRIEYMLRFGNAYGSEQVPEDIGAYDRHLLESYIAGDSETLPTLSVEPVQPWQILAITFTNKAANELKNRIVSTVGAAGSEVAAGTFHSVCAKLLRYHGDRLGYSSHFTIYDTDDQKRMMKRVYGDLDIDEKMLPIKSTMAAISGAKDSLIDPEEYEKEAGPDERKRAIARLYAGYEKALRAADAMDFDDLIVNTVRLFRTAPDLLEKYQRRFRYIMVDEYQDTNHAQYVFVSALAAGHKNLCVVGDDDQSIYRFRGATIRNILEFEDEYSGSKVIRLEQNYRSTSVILNAANAVIANNKGRKGKTLWTALDGGAPVRVHTAADENGEARFVQETIEENVQEGDCFADHAILYRTNAQSRAFEMMLTRTGIPYRVIGGNRFYDRKEIKDVLAYLQLIHNHNDAIRLHRIINEPKRGIGDTSMARVAAIAADFGVSEYEVISRPAEFPLPGNTASKFAPFCELIDRLTELAESGTVTALCEAVLAESGYEDALIAAGAEEQDRVGNVHELVSDIRQYEEKNENATLAGYLEEVALVSDIDKYDETADAVVMMTVHSAKGLEFKNVFLVGMEEGLFPGGQSIYGTPEDIEEERRLAYVAITRAKRKLWITNAYTRMTHGKTGRNPASRFLGEVPEELCEITSNAYGGFGATVRFSDGPSYSSPSRGFASRPAPRPAVWQKPAEKPAAKPAVKPAPAVTYHPGERVRHRVFGDGAVLSVTPMGNDTLLQIAFDSGETKKLMANFARLETIKGEQ